MTLGLIPWETRALVDTVIAAGPLAADWNLRDTGWHISVDGDAPLEVSLHMPIPLDRMAETSPAYTANRAVNAVPWVCAATPGIVTTVDLPHVMPQLR